MKHGRKLRRPYRLFGLVWLIVVSLWPQVPAEGQIRVFRGPRPPLPNAQGGDEEEATDSVFYPPDRDTLQRLARAAELIKEKRYGEAARFLSSILESAEDYFFQPERGRPLYRSLKQEAQRMIGEL
ncbi:MAG TPA: hypothetical protein VFI31_03075, partial [Pirellulales bacterium]|nr:hypothetical protein [Pirellulales bacterium]